MFRSLACITLHYINMKKSFLYFTVMVALLTMPFAFTSCGNPDPDDGEPVVDSKDTKIEVSFSGDYSKFSPSIGFYAFDFNGKGLKMQTSDGEKDMSWSKLYDDAPYNTASAEINDYFSTFNASIILTNAENTKGNVTITGKVFYDGKLYRSDIQQVEIKQGMTGAAYSYNPSTGFTNQMY